MKTDNDLQIQVAWAEMPLSKEQLELIDYSHRSRPYVLFMDKGSYYYAFPCTSKISSNNIRYENQKVVFKSGLSYQPSLVNLGQLYELPKENLESSIYNINSKYYNEIIKKLNACSEYSNYPDDFIEYFTKFDYTLDKYDLIEFEEQLYLITDFRKHNYVVSKVFPYPVNESILAQVDGLKYYIYPKSNALYNTESYKYRSHIYPYYVRGKEPIEIEEKDYSKLYNLEPGMVITYDDEEKTNKMVVLENCITDLFVIHGEEKQTFSTFEPMNIPVDTNIEYKVVGFLNDDRLNKLIDTKTVTKNPKILK